MLCIFKKVQEEGGALLSRCKSNPSADVWSSGGALKLIFFAFERGFDLSPYAMTLSRFNNQLKADTKTPFTPK